MSEPTPTPPPVPGPHTPPPEHEQGWINGIVRTFLQSNLSLILLVMEAMKMEHNLRVSRAGVVEKTSGTVGQIVDTEAAIVTLVKGN